MSTHTPWTADTDALLIQAFVTGAFIGSVLGATLVATVALLGGMLV